MIIAQILKKSNIIASNYCLTQCKFRYVSDYSVKLIMVCEHTVPEISDTAKCFSKYHFLFLIWVNTEFVCDCLYIFVCPLLHDEIPF